MLQLSSRLPSPYSQYASAHELYNQRFDGIEPAAVAYCQSPTDVQQCIAFARAHGVPLAPRSGGHSYGGYSTCRGLVIDVTSMASVTVGPSGDSAVVGAGAHLIDVYQQLGNAGVLVPAGSCPTVGIAGLTLGGGVGVFGRKYGLTCDNLTGVQMVTADGQVRMCSASENADLFWASQGGGGGNFGVVTSFTFRVHPIPSVSLFTLDWPWSAAATMAGACQSWMPSAPDELWSDCQLLSNGATGSSPGYTARLTGVYVGESSALTGLLQPLLSMLSSAGVSPTYQFVGSESYLDAMLSEGGCEGESVAQCHLPSQSPAGMLARTAFAAKSAYVSVPASSAGLQAVVAAVQSLQSSIPSASGGFVFDFYGGAINRVAPGATAFVHRDALYGVQYSVTWPDGSPSSVVSAANSWLAQSHTTFTPYANGQAYQNYIDPTLTGWEQAYYGANLPRLVSIKQRYDPDDVFHFAQSIPIHLGS